MRDGAPAEEVRAREQACEVDRGGVDDAELLALERANVDWFWRTDAEHRFTWVSDSFFEATGIALDDLVGRSRLDYLRTHPSMESAFRDHRKDLDARRPFRDFIFPLTNARASSRWVSSTGVPRFDEDGAFVGYVGAGRNVTGALATFEQLEFARRQLEENNVVLGEVFAALSAGLVVFGADDRLIMYNRHMVELYPRLAGVLAPGIDLRTVIATSYEPEHKAGPAADRPVDDGDARGAFIDRQLKGLWMARTERVHQLDDGRWVHVLNRRLSNGMLVGLRIDITKLKERETELGAALDRARIAEEMINGVTDAIFVKDADGRYVLANKTFAGLIGKTPEQVLGRTDFDLVETENAERYSRVDGRILVTGEAFELEEQVLLPNGTVGNHILRKNRISLPTGAKYISCMLVDITAQKAQEASLASARDALQEALNEVNNYKLALDKTAIVAFYDTDLKITYVNDRFCEVTQFDREEVIGHSFVSTDTHFHPPSFIEAMKRKTRGGETWTGEVRNRRKNGSTWWAETTIVPLMDKAGSISQYVMVRYDITARKAAEEQMHKAQSERTAAMSILKDVIDTVPDGIVAYDEDDRLIFHNKAYKEIYRLSAPAIRKGASFESILRYGVQRGQYPEAGKTPQEQQEWLKKRLRFHRRKRHDASQKIDGGRWVQLRDRRSQSGHVVGVRTDITAQRHAEAEIRRYAETDDLTGANNRKAFYARMEALLKQAPGNRVHALAIIDLDRFKEINDTLGHDAGDEYICEVVRRLESCCRKHDIIARLGGDEFAVALTGLSGPEHAEDRIARLRQVFQVPLTLQGELFKPSVSTGVALFPRDGSNLAEIMKAADTALYEAKSGGRDRCAFYQRRLGEERRTRQETALKLASAIHRNEICIALQPQVHLADGRLAGFEALARWRHPDGIIMPNAFIDVATEHGLIVPLGQTVLDQSVAAMRRMLDRGIDPVQVAVNIAGPQLKLDGFADRVAALLRRYDIEPRRLEIEITEEVLLDRSPELIHRALEELRACGVMLALDDFGTGYASLSHLKQFKVHRLKIDRSFIHDIGKDPENTAISLAILDLASSFGMEVVAEGIETREQLDFLRSRGCKIGQGYLFGRPDWPEAYGEARDWSLDANVA